MKLEKRKGLVRGVITVDQGNGSFEPIKAYTFWFRHDDPQLERRLQIAINKLCNAYTYSNDYASMMIAHEWKDYRS